MRWGSIVLAGMVMASSSAMAASIYTVPVDARTQQGDLVRTTAIKLQGEIVLGDFARFKKVADRAGPGTFVYLESPGGTAIEGMMIGEYVREKRFETVVDDRTTCASACAMIWLAGVRRFKAPGGAIGFHGVSDGHGQSLGVGNAVYGAYMAHLGYSYDAIIWAASAASDEAFWIDENSAKVGIAWLKTTR